MEIARLWTWSAAASVVAAGVESLRPPVAEHATELLFLVEGALEVAVEGEPARLVRAPATIMCEAGESLRWTALEPVRYFAFESRRDLPYDA